MSPPGPVIALPVGLPTPADLVATSRVQSGLLFGCRCRGLIFTQCVASLLHRLVTCLLITRIHLLTCSIARRTPGLFILFNRKFESLPAEDDIMANAALLSQIPYILSTALQRNPLNLKIWQDFVPLYPSPLDIATD